MARCVESSCVKCLSRSPFSLCGIRLACVSDFAKDAKSANLIAPRRMTMFNAIRAATVRRAASRRLLTIASASQTTVSNLDSLWIQYPAGYPEIQSDRASPTLPCMSNNPQWFGSFKAVACGVLFEF